MCHLLTTTHILLAPRWGAVIFWTTRNPGRRSFLACPYSPSKVIHSWRGEPSPSSPQPTVNNFAPRGRDSCEQFAAGPLGPAVTPRWKTNSLPSLAKSKPRVSLQRGAWTQNEYSDAHSQNVSAIRLSPSP